MSGWRIFGGEELGRAREAAATLCREAQCVVAKAAERYRFDPETRKWYLEMLIKLESADADDSVYSAGEAEGVAEAGPQPEDGEAVYSESDAQLLLGDP